MFAPEGFGSVVGQPILQLVELSELRLSNIRIHRAFQILNISPYSIGF